MKIIIALITILTSGCTNTTYKPYLIVGATIALAQLEEKVEGDSYHTQASFLIGSTLTNIGFTKSNAAIVCTSIGTIREIYKDRFKDVKFSYKDALFNLSSCIIGSNFRLRTDKYGTPTLNYTIKFK